MRICQHSWTERLHKASSTLQRVRYSNANVNFGSHNASLSLRTIQDTSPMLGAGSSLLLEIAGKHSYVGGNNWLVAGSVHWLLGPPPGKEACDASTGQTPSSSETAEVLQSLCWPPASTHVHFCLLQFCYFCDVCAGEKPRSQTKAPHWRQSSHDRDKPTRRQTD